MRTLNLLNLLSQSEKNKIQKICYLLSDKLTPRDVEECLICHNELIDSTDYHKAATIEFALYTIANLVSTAGDVSASAEIAIEEIFKYLDLKENAKLEEVGVI